MSVENSKKVLEHYFSSDDDNAFAEDVVFTIMGTGEEHRGAQAVRQMLDAFYRVAFTGSVEPRNMVYGEQGAVGEWDFVGTHRGTFDGIPATGKQVRVPLVVSYDIVGEQIKRARVYLDRAVMRQQLTG